MAHVLLTGFPGFIGRRLARHLLAADPDARLTALVEERMVPQARDVAERMDAERLELLTGDITDRRLGLDESDYQRLAREITHVFHLAAIYDLSVPADLAQQVNVAGTGNVLDLCLAASGLERLVYASTAYVAGMRTGVAYEHELVMGQEFKNHYESTKFQAEVWVREAMDRVPTTILRPAIVVGDSQSGETEKFDGPYYLLRVISEAAARGRSVPQFGRADAPFNVVPVDYVVRAIASAATSADTVGETLHLVDPDALTTRELVEVLSREYAGREPRGRIPPRLVAASLRLAPVRERFGGAPPESIVYLNHPVRFDTRRAIDLLGPIGLRPPSFTDYAGVMVGFFAEHETDPAYEPRR